MSLGRTVQVEIARVGGGRTLSLEDVVATEEPLEIRIVGEGPGGPITTIASITMRTPGNDFELAAGFLVTEGIVRSPRDIARIDYCLGETLWDQEFNVVSVELLPTVTVDESVLARNFYMTSSCGVCGKASLDALRAQGCQPVPFGGSQVAEAVLYRLHDKLRRSQDVFQQTGGLHAAGLFTFGGELVVSREDVGRHNAVDKVVGDRCLAGELPASDHVLVVSGRASFEIIQKAAMAGIPVVAAVGAPSSMAVDTAQAFSMTLVGFLKRDGFNVYAGASRIALSS